MSDIRQLLPSSLALLLGLLVPGPSEAASPRRAVRVHADGTLDLAMIVRRLENQGARIRHLVAPDLLLGDIPDAALLSVRSSGLELELVNAPDGAGPRSMDTDASSRSARLGRRYLDGPLEPGDDRPPPPPLHGDALPADPRDGLRRHAGGSCRGPGRVLVGRVAIGILMLESDGTIDSDTEDWANEDPEHPGLDRTELVMAEIIEGMDALVSQFPEADLSFAYDPRIVTIPYEAINRGAGERWTWGGAALESLGYAGFTDRDSYIADLEERFDADSGTVAFVLDSLNDEDGNPSSGNFAYAVLDGDYFVMTYDNADWRIDGMDVVIAHELAHNYGALDEYRAAGNTCSHVAGFLRVRNGNNDSEPGDGACESAVACFMRGNRTHVACSFTAGQLGIRDSDGDGIIDPLDAPPDSSLDGPPLQVFETDSPALTGTVSSLPEASESPHARPAAFNDITAAEVRVDGGAWMPLVASDGAFGDACEEVDIALSGLSEGLHLIELRGTNDVGLVEPSPAEVGVYVNTDCADDSAEPDDSIAQARTRSVGRHVGLMRCAHDADWSRFHLASDAELRVTVEHDPLAGPLTACVLDPSHRTQATATSTDGALSLTTTARVDGTHYLAIDGIDEDETVYQLTLDADCLDGPSEPNGDPATGTGIALGLTENLVVCPGDVDFYLVSTHVLETLHVQVDFDHDLGDLDLIVHAPDGTVAGRSDGLTDSESVEVRFAREGVHAIEVRGKTPTDTNVHDLTVTLTGCHDDIRENDDTQADARPMTPGEPISGRLCDTDDDWYSFIVPETSLLRVQLAHSLAEGGLDLELHRAEPVGLFRRSTRLTSPEDITVQRAAPGEYFLRVLSSLGGTSAYELTVEVEDPLLLFVSKTETDAVLDWNDVGQECYLVSRSELPSDFAAAVEALVNDPPGDEDGEPLTTHVDPGVIGDDVPLHAYRVRPHDCGRARIEATQIVSPAPCARPGLGGIGTITYTISASNPGEEDLFGISLENTLPDELESFRVLSVPPGATETTVGRDLLVTGIDLPAGEIASVLIEGTLPRLMSDWPLIPGNQAVFRVPDGIDPLGALFPTDDPTTLAYRDDTRTAYWGDYQLHAVAAYWHADLDLDLVLVDPCGNTISVADSRIGDCDSSIGEVNEEHSCTMTIGSGRHESILWTSSIPIGTYDVFIRWAETAEDGPDCRDRGPEDVTIMIVGQNFGGLRCHPVTIEPSPEPVHVLSFSFPR
ncbi:MAG: hypothetical protein AAF533_23790 [Acidobacteriota bacterium]